jgi:hypothetical protein
MRHRDRGPAREVTRYGNQAPTIPAAGGRTGPGIARETETAPQGAAAYFR